MRSHNLVPLAIVGLACVLMVGCGHDFTDNDIVDIQQSITREFQARPGVTVKEVHLLKTGDRKLTGFVKFGISILGQPLDVTKSCEATMSNEDSTYFWKCD